jgi:hypothetical protein
MKKRAKSALAFIAVILTALTTYRYAFAANDDATDQATVIMNGLGNRPALVAFDFGGGDGVDRTVLVNSTIVELGGKRFLGGTVTDKYPEIEVAFPGTVAYVALDRIAYIQYLDGADPKDGK